MNILYAAGVCSENKFNELYEKKIIQKLPQAQKYHRLLVEGVRENIDGDLMVLSSFPTNRRWTSKVFFKKETESIQKIQYVYLPFVNYPIIRQTSLFLSSFLNALSFFKKHKDAYVICDLLNSSNAQAVKLASKFYKRKCIAIVTDVPGYTSGARAKSLPKYVQLVKKLADKYKEKSLHKFDGYVLLSEEMNAVVNKKHKGYIVAEGHCDIKMKIRQNRIEDKQKPNVILYTGGIHEEFGIKRMVDAFLKCNNDGWQMHICGDGNYQKELTYIAKNNDNVKYFGVVTNEEAVKKQLSATLLINPRLTDAEYVKYSFPSKNMEYMISGTPMMTTKLPSMPKSYYEHVFLIEDESIEGFEKAFNEVFSLSDKEHHEKGKNAKEFVSMNKNNVIQAKRILDCFDKNLSN